METNKEKYSSFPDVPRRKGKLIDWKKLKRGAAWRKNMAGANKNNVANIAVFQAKLSVCPICKSGKFHDFIEVYACKYSECESCGHLFMQPPLDLNVVKKLYSGGEGGSMQKLVYLDEEIFSKRMEQIALPKIEYCNSVIGEKGLWIDIGCGAGEFLVAARKTGWEIKGFEADAVEADFARRRGIEVVQEYITAANAPQLKDAKAVSLINVLEHINNPAEFLGAIAGGLQKGAFVVFEVPRHPSLSSFVNLAFPHLPYRHICPPDHLHIFTEKSVELMLNGAGLKAVGVWEFGQDAVDLILAAANNAGLKESDLIERMIALADDMQKTVDEQSLSDILFMVAVKS
ncbi:MAG: class I SAM-dependent methyltransferase [Patescibacteria group bacterium]